MKAKLICLVCAWLLGTQASVAFAVDAREEARNHYETGLSLFDHGDREQALVEFKLAYELFPNNDVVFMLAQCEYHLGKLKEARAHYETFLNSDPKSTLAENARLRIAAIDRRPSVLVINTVPSDVAVKIEGQGQSFEGQAPNEFSVPKGRYRITVTRPNFQAQVRDVNVGIAETVPMFFKLDPVPGRLIIATDPNRTTLFVRGMRAENPYNQRVEPGLYEIYAEAENHESRRDTVEVRAGQDTVVNFELNYVQRSGRPDLIAAWGLVGAVGSVALVMDLVAGPTVTNIRPSNPASLSLLAAAAGTGAVAGGLLGSRLAPSYIPDNKSMYRIGSMTIGTLEGTLLALSVRPGLTSGLVGGAVGLVAGSGIGALTDSYAPSYGRVTLIQSLAAMGGLAGVLAVPAFDFARGHSELVALAGLNAGLLAGIIGAVRAGSERGPSWQRVVLVDLTVAAGVFAGAVVGTIPNCTNDNGSSEASCSFEDSPTTTKLALIGGGLGFAAGWLLTSGMDQNPNQGRRGTSPAVMPTVSAMPTQNANGRWSLTPALSAQGTF